MRSYRMSKGETEHYSSFAELGKAWGCKPLIKQTKDKTKLGKQRENFSKGYLCPACKMPMQYIGGNMMVCQNESCNGIKYERKTDTGETKTWYTVPYEIMDEKSSEIAYNIFTDFSSET